MQIISSPPQANAEVVINENFVTVNPAALYGIRQPVTTGLTWGYYGGQFNGNTVADGTITLTASSTNYIVANRSTGVVTGSTSTANWDNSIDYIRLYSVATGTSSVSSYADSRQAYGGDGGGGAGNPTQCIPVACSDETTALTTGASKVTFRMPYAFTLSEVRASLTTAPTGSTLVVDINQNGASILSTKISIDASEKTSTTAATPPVISGAALADDAEITIDLDQIGSTNAGTGLKVYLIGAKT